MNAKRVTFSADANQVVVTLSQKDAADLRMQMLAFWRSLSVGGQDPTGNTPFARLYAQLTSALK